MSQPQEPKKENPMSTEFLEKSLKRLRKKLTFDQDTMECTAFAIRAIENDLQKIQEEDSEANETR